MTGLRIIFAFMFLVVFMLGAFGCQKEVSVTFVNTTDQRCEVILCTREHGCRRVGEISPSGGRGNIRLQFNKLPAIVVWKAGDAGGMLAVDKPADGEIVQYIFPAYSTESSEATLVQK